MQADKRQLRCASFILNCIPITIRNRQNVDPSSPMPITKTGENLSPSCPVMKDPPAYVNIKPESIAASVRGLTPAWMKDILTFVYDL